LFAEIDPWLILPIAGWTLCYGFVIAVMVPPVRKKSERVSEANSSLSGRIVDGYTNIMVVKSFAHAAREDAFARAGFERQLAASRDLLRAIVRMTVTLTVLNGLLIFAVGGLALWLWSVEAASVGGVALALGLAIRLNQMSGWILRTITSLFENIGTVENGIATISRPTAVRDPRGARGLTVREGAITFDHVRFHYGRTDGIIDDFSLEVRPGERVGLVGRSGAGKSTLVALLRRFYDLESGRILIDGTDIADVTQESLRAAIGLVTQDAALLHRSIADNIAYGQPDATLDQIIEAARRAHAHEFILDARDPTGRTSYAAHVGERGVKLSGGQRQRVAIARVLLKNAPVLVLDEATSALDSEVEAAIQDELETLMEDKTVIAIAHRLSTIARMDRLVVIDEGRIIETGHHNDLVARGGLYADLWSRQSGGFIAADLDPREPPLHLDAAQ
jgi:ATP-binding cassette subfamily B multidrug efflux pump